MRKKLVILCGCLILMTAAANGQDPGLSPESGGHGSETLRPGLATWTDRFGETRFMLHVTGAVAVNETLRVQLSVWDPFYPDEIVSSPWRFHVDGLEIVDEQFLTLSESSWVREYAFTYDTNGVHEYVFTAQDLGHGMAVHYWEWFELEVYGYVGDDLAGVEDTRTAAVALTNAPNPFQQATTLCYELATPAPVTLRIYDSTGRLKRVLLDDTVREAGRHQTFWNRRDARGRPVNAGIYFCHLKAGDNRQVIRLVCR